jgi:hypothetical protein
MVQPCPLADRLRFSARALSKKVSQNGEEPLIRRIGRV